jgi:hypothetical protein
MRSLDATGALTAGHMHRPVPEPCGEPGSESVNVNPRFIVNPNEGEDFPERSCHNVGKTGCGRKIGIVGKGRG